MADSEGDFGVLFQHPMQIMQISKQIGGIFQHPVYISTIQCRYLHCRYCRYLQRSETCFNIRTTFYPFGKNDMLQIGAAVKVSAALLLSIYYLHSIYTLDIYTVSTLWISTYLLIFVAHTERWEDTRCAVVTFLPAIDCIAEFSREAQSRSRVQF